MSRKAQSGQAIVVVALSMIVILGGVVLAVDGGQVFAARRSLQNTADFAAEDAGFFMAKGGDWLTAGNASVQRNYPGAQATITSQDATDPKTPGAHLINVRVWTQKQTFFAGLFGMPSVEVSAQAVELVLPKRLQATTAGTVTAVSSSCNNAASLHNGGFELPNLVSYNDTNATAANGHIDNSIHVNLAQYSTHVLVDSDITLPAPLPSYGLPDLASYDPGGSAAIRAGADYHLINGDFAPNFNQAGTPPLKGLYRIVNGAFNPKGSPVVDPAGVTIVADGSITVSANSITMNAFMDNLLFASLLPTSCAGNAIHLSTKDATLIGGVYAPNGGIDFSLSTTTVTGWSWSQTVSISSSNASFTADANLITPLAEPRAYLLI